ncbi:MAG TPA: ComF family protein [Methylophilus sp.]
MLAIKPLYQHVLAQQCVLCANATHTADSLCAPCLADLPWAPAHSCQQCGLPSHHRVCGACLSDPPHFDFTHAVFQYGYPVDALLHAYKYQHALHLSLSLGNLMVTAMMKTLQSQHIEVLIPMPLHPQRLKERGFNQSLELAKVMAKQTGIALNYQHCQRIRNTPPQASLKLKDRVRNIKGAFEYCGQLQGQHVAIIDDVMTSGASVNELAKILKQAGAASVTCCLVARTL